MRADTKPKARRNARPKGVLAFVSAFVRAMYKKGAGNDKQGKDAGNRTLCPYRNFSQAIISPY